MPNAVSPSAPLATRPVVIIAAAVGGVVLAGTLALWGHFGSTVFFEMIATGFANCF